MYHKATCDIKKASIGPEHLTATSQVTKDVFLFIQKRELGLRRAPPMDSVNKYMSHHMPGLFREKECNVGNINKIFASQWLSDKQVVYGTKCNKLIVCDLMNGRETHIPSLRSSETSSPAVCPCGIHSISINPSRTLLATGAENTNDLAVYKLPTFDPLCVGENGHKDWIFDVTWLDDEFCVSGSRDSRLCLWKIGNDDDSSSSPHLNLQVPEYTMKNPIAIRDVDKSVKVRALAYFDDRRELGVLSLNAYFHLWDIERFTEIYNRRLPHSRENVCMAVSKLKTLYAIGSQSHVNLVDPRSKNTLTTIISKYRGQGIRSVSFRDDMITIGTGVGMILFFDIKAGKYLESGCGHSCHLSLGRGWLLHDENYREYFMDQQYPNAAYTHKYNDMGNKLFVAGGPLPAGLWGNYAGVWS
ncbi:hypothetical protein CHS0354_026154 [Potamilus streckersoni]|uniref:DDB1- and CUL4-associated factor 12 beta-propeller domain-containing protein n=1 Tax=Potamilus streckersoni TaxID=2493646 RepID=A0AAE0S1M5_9BIVA|nr:hypothetical protein CHS0354_026154 [Potamilus streckersoni]